MPVRRRVLFNELEVKIENDPEVKLQTLAFAERVKEYWQDIAPDAGDPGHPYATGHYKDSIQRIASKGRGPRGRWIWHHWVGTFDTVAGLLEYGTGYDYGPESKGNWIGLDGERHWGWKTPTPAFAYAARAAAHFGGTMDDD